jgi:hypothetical protein
MNINHPKHVVENEDKVGWIDIHPVDFRNDVSSNSKWDYNQIGNTARYAYEANNSDTLRRLHAKFHIPHLIQMNQPDSHIHIHWETTSESAGNIILDCYLEAALRDGSWSSEYHTIFTLSPFTSKSIGKQIVTEIAIPSQLIPYITIDSLFQMRLIRNRNSNSNDTFNGSVFCHTLDIHTRTDLRPTTEKDYGIGWVKS